MKRFVKALSEPMSGLTYLALTAYQKQSVVDAEYLFNPGLANFMGYDFEAKYIRTIRIGGGLVMNMVSMNVKGLSSIMRY